MSRYIHIADAKGRDAEIIFNSKPKKPTVKLVTEKVKKFNPCECSKAL